MELKPKMTKEEAKKEVKKRRDKDSQMVNGIFKNLENAASSISRGALSFGFKAYPGDEFAFYEFLDGERYRIPLGVAKHINNGCFYYTYEHNDPQMQKLGIQAPITPDGRITTAGNQRYRVGKKVHRFAFFPLDFTNEDLENDLKRTNLVEVSATY